MNKGVLLLRRMWNLLLELKDYIKLFLEVMLELLDIRKPAQ